MSTYFSYQSQQFGCGYAIIKMRLASLTGNPNYLHVPEPPASNGSSIQDLFDYAKSFGLKLSGYRASRKEELRRNATWPLYLLLHSGDALHLVLALKRSKKGIYTILDPEEGKRHVKEEDLMEAWSSYFLVEEGFEEIKKPEKNAHNRMKPYEVAGISFFSLLALSIVAGNRIEGPWKYLPIGLGLLSAVALIILSFLSDSAFDKFYFASYFRDGVTRDRFKRFAKARAITFAGFGRLYLSLLIAFLPGLVFGEGRGEYILLGVGLTAMLTFLPLRAKLSDEEYGVTLKEQAFIRSSSEERKATYEKAKQRSGVFFTKGFLLVLGLSFLLASIATGIEAIFTSEFSISFLIEGLLCSACGVFALDSLLRQKKEIDKARLFVSHLECINGRAYSQEGKEKVE